MKVVTKASRRNEKVQIMKTKAHKAVGVCRAIRTLLLIGGVALAYCTSTNAAISSGTITLNGAATSSLVITEGVSIALSATFTDTVPTNNDGAVVIWGDNTTNAGTVVTSSLGSNITVTASHQYANTTASPVTVTVTVTNVLGVSGANTISSSGDIADAPLTFVPTAPASVTEGILASNVTLLTFIDSNSSATTNQYGPVVHSELITPTGGVYSQAYSIVSLGLTNGGALFAVQGTLEYYLSGSNTISITVNDLGGSSLTGTGVVNIADAPLTLVSTGVLVYTEGTVGPSNETLLTFIDGNTLANSNQTGSVSQFVASVSWGDMSTPNTLTNNTSNISSNDTLAVGRIAIVNVASNVFALVGEHAYPTDGTYYVTIQLNDIEGAALQPVSGIPDSVNVSDAGLTVVYVNPNLTTLPGFESLAQASGNSLGDELIAFIDTNEFSAVSPISVQPYTYYLSTISWGDGTASTGIVQHVSGNEFAVYGNHTYNVTCTNYPLIVKVVDLAGGAFCVSTNFAIIQDAPIISYGYSINAAANSTFSGTVASFTDPDTALSASSFTATIDWGDNTPYTSGTIVAYGNDVYLVQGTHSYVAAPLTSETVKVTVTDANVCAVPQLLNASTITFTGTSPGISFLYGLLSNYIAVGTGSSFTTNLATFTDSSLPPGDAFDLSALISWGDGTASDGGITTNAAGQYVVEGTHTYLDDGAYAVTVEVEDIDGNHNTLSNITIVAESQYTDLTSSMEVLFGDVKITSSKVGSAYEYGFNDYYSEVVTLVNISGTTLAGPFGLVVKTSGEGSNNIDLLNITGRLADGREYIPLSVDTLKPKAKLKVTVHWAEAEAGATGPVILPVRLIAGPGL